MCNIGKEKITYNIEPLENPVPAPKVEQPVDVPESVNEK